MNVRGTAYGVGIAASTMALAVACSSSASSPSSSAPAASGQLLATSSTPLGTILIDAQARTVYQFAKDTAGVSACTGTCATVWPPVTVSSTLPASLPGITGQLGEIARTDGTKQLTIDQRPIYTFTGDKGAGQTNGQGKVVNGGLWTVLSPTGAPVNGAAPSSDSGGGYGGGGY